MSRYYFDGSAVKFNIYHSGQYCIFLYYLSNEIYKMNGASDLCDKVYCLNKALNSCDLFYEIELPDIFSLDHPVGSVMGRAKYGNHFTFMQNCTIGQNHDIYPIIGEHVTMYPKTMILGDCHIGNNVEIAAETYIKDTNIPDNSLVFGISPHLTIKSKPPTKIYS
jgi:serine O-acetyltransferase